MYRTLIALSVAGMLIGCGETNLATEEGRQDAAAELRQERTEARRAMRNQIQDLEREIAELKAHAAEAGEDTEQAWDESVGQLERKTADLRREWESLEDSSEDAWNDFSQRAKQTINQIEMDLKQAADKIG